MDAYCERVGMGLLAEPLNAFSNVSFLLAAWAAWVLARRVGAFGGVLTLVLSIWKAEVRFLKLETLPNRFSHRPAWARL